MKNKTPEPPGDQNLVADGTYYCHQTSKGFFFAGSQIEFVDRLESIFIRDSITHGAMTASINKSFVLIFIAVFFSGCQGSESLPPNVSADTTNDVSTSNRAAPTAPVEIGPSDSDFNSGGTDLSPKTTMTNSANKNTPYVSLVYASGYTIKLGGLEKLHPFDIAKYDKIHKQLLIDGVIEADTTLEPSPLKDEDLLLVHTADYLERLKERKNIARYLEAEILLAVPLSLEKNVLQPFRLASGGTLLAARRSLETGIGINLGGGYHHAKPNVGEGFCVYADVPVAIRRLQREGLIDKALVIDVDVHQGNGTTVCLADDDSTYTFSMHQGDIYPIPKEVSDLDVEVRAGDGDEEFIATMEQHLEDVFEHADADICFIVGGCDPLAGDPLASLEMTHEGIKNRDALLIANCVERDIPVVLTLSGGYSPDAWEAQYLSVKNIIETYGVRR